MRFDVMGVVEWKIHLVAERQNGSDGKPVRSGKTEKSAHETPRMQYLSRAYEFA
jgi:hypothetical protein